MRYIILDAKFYSLLLYMYGCAFKFTVKCTCFCCKEIVSGYGPLLYVFYT